MSTSLEGHLPPRIRLLADDLTGALDSAAAFAGAVPVYLDEPGADDAPVSAVATATRDVPLLGLRRQLARSLAWLPGATLAFKKVDSLLRGNTFAECALAARGFERVVFAPAFPAQGRVTLDGRAWVRQPGSTVLHPIGRQPVIDALAAAGLTGPDVPEVWVPDVRDDADLDAVAALARDPASRRWLWCGSAGLAHALARSLGMAARPAPVDAVAPPVWLVSASRHEVLRRQWARLLAEPAVAPAVEAFAFAAAEPLNPALAAARLGEQMDALVARPARPGALVVIGGDTLRALCVASAATALLSEASPRPGWGRARLVGGRFDGLVCHSRSGAFGTDDDLLAMVREVTGT
ncbi:MAG TPA: four-carbon acid sugar kinase family protein [Burkholderiaceae bacterium]|nr:four-carbon acid sugar kinase family protein [Burkholderiaceae bacterium]